MFIPSKLLAVLLLLFTCNQHIEANNTSVSYDFHAVLQGFVVPTDQSSDKICSHVQVDVPVTAAISSDETSLDTANNQVVSSVGNCTNNLTTPESITGPKAEEDSPNEIDPPAAEDTTAETPKQSIPTFDDWTKEKLKKEQRKAAAVVNSKVSTGGVPSSPAIPAAAASTRNYASKECGAKVLQSNAEAENTKAVLNDKEKDEYMRNPCEKAESKFVIVELCETIQPRRIEVANFELFSSGPKDFRIFVSERFPAIDWKLVGEFTAEDNRLLQSFELPTPVYSKFVKLELVTHHGKEHFCTLSVLKVLGISMVDEYEIEAEAAVHIPVPEVADESAPLPTESAVAEPVVGSETNIDENQKDKLLEKDTVGGIVNKVVSGEILTNIVNVVKNKFGGVSEKETKRRQRSFDLQLCQVCPINPSCIVPTHLCWVFVWRPKKVEQLAPPSSRVHFNSRSISERIRRRRISFLQRDTIRRAKKLADDRNIFKAAIVEETATLEAPMATTTPMPASVQHQQNNQAHTSSSPPVQDTLPAASVSHKESVFMKLNKRIAQLEYNMSLSSEYLSELSRQYVAQADEQTKYLEQAKRAAVEVAEDVESRLNSTISARMKILREEMDTLSGWLKSMRASASAFTIAQLTGHYKRTSEKAHPTDDDGQCPEDLTSLKHFTGDGFDHIWTTEQVLYTVVSTQLLTVVVVFFLSCYFRGRREVVLPNPIDLNQLVLEKVEEVLRRQAEERQNQLSLNNADKRRRRRQRQKETALRDDGSSIADDGAHSCDSAATPITSQTETSSEAECSRVPLKNRFVPVCTNMAVRGSDTEHDRTIVVSA